MPREQDLPDDIALLARKQTWEVSDLRWKQDVGKLIEKISGDIPGRVQRLAPRHSLFPRTSTKKFFIPLAATIFFVSTVIYALWLLSSTRRPEAPHPCPKLLTGEAQYYEAEDADLSGGASRDSEHLGFSGDAFVSGYGVPPWAATTFWVDVPSDGQYQVNLCYANGTNSAKTLTIFVNEARFKQTRLPNNTSRWDTWLIQTESLTLRAGRNAISYQKSQSDNGQVNLDFIGIVREPIISDLPSRRQHLRQRRR